MNEYTSYVKLAEALNQHAYLYHTLDKPSISDSEYDVLYQKLLKIEKEHTDWILAYSPSKKVGGEIKKTFEKSIHDPPMKSLDNAYSIEDFIHFSNKVKKILNTNEVEYHCEPKFDGLAIELIYEKGVFIEGSTRGNGEIGENITHNLKTIKNIPLQLQIKNPPEWIVIRGECIIPYTEFERVNFNLKNQDKPLFANPRNLAAGTLRQKDSSLVAHRLLLFYPYTVAKIKGDQHKTCPQLQANIYQNYFKALGFSLFPYLSVGNESVVKDYYDFMQKQRSKLDFDLDGLVIKVNDTQLWKSLGYTSKAPRYAIAIKFETQKAMTQIMSISFQVGRTGVVTPVAHLKPINVGGVIIKKATLHNIEEIKRLNLHLNQLVEIERAGDVIPKVVCVVKDDASEPYKSIQIPNKCPSCKSLLVKEDVYLRCIENSCPDKKLAYLKYVASKQVLNFDGLGSEWVQKFFEKKLIDHFLDFYKLQKEHIINLDGMGDILATKIIQSIDLKREISFQKFILALGIPNIGNHVADILANEWLTLDNLAKSTIEELESVYEVGPKIAHSIYNYFQNDEYQVLITQLAHCHVKIISPVKPTQEPNIYADSTKIHNKTFLFTGTLETLSRDEAQHKIKENGGKFVTSLSKKTNFLVIGSAPGSKLKKAKELNVTILTEKEFLNLIKNT